MDEITDKLNAIIKSLQAREKKLIALEAAGVDNWEGYSDALKELDDEEDIYGPD